MTCRLRLVRRCGRGGRRDGNGLVGRLGRFGAHAARRLGHLEAQELRVDVFRFARLDGLDRRAPLFGGFDPAAQTEEDVAATIGLIEECGFHKLHLFPFSPRPGTPAAKLKPLPAAVVKERMARLAGVEARLLERSLERQVGREVNVTVEGRPADGWWKGLTESYHRVRVKGPSTPGLARVRISGIDGKSLLAVPVAEVHR